MTKTQTAAPPETRNEGKTLLDFQDVEMTFPNGTVALSGVDLTVRKGEFVTVVGPSGCGKSTLLRIASGLETATDGTVNIATSRIGYVFQDATLLPWRNVQAQCRTAGRAATGSPRPTGRRRPAKPSIWSGSKGSSNTFRGSSPAA